MIETFDKMWLNKLRHLMDRGREVSPRGKMTKELLHQMVMVDMRYPVLTHPARVLSYQFMAAEAYWILTGDNTVEGIAPYNKHIANFSDDGIRFFGAYGPKIMSQIHYVVETLKRDRESRQAGMTLWRENPPTTKDVPCTIAIFASIRQMKLDVHVFMRSSDVWLGLPYDIFNFSMLGHLICCQLNHTIDPPILPGRVWLTAASMHAYQTDFEKIHSVFDSIEYEAQCAKPRPTHDDLHLIESMLFERLAALRQSVKGDPIRWWES